MWQQMGRDERRKMGIVLGMTLIYGCVLGSQFYVARLVNVLGGTATHAGLLLILSVLPIFAVAICGRRVTARLSAPLTLQLGLVCHALQLLLLALAPNIATLMPAMILSGLGYALTFATLLNGATALVPVTHYAQGIAYMTLSSQLGIGSGSLIAAMVEPAFGTRGVFWLPMVLAIAGAMLASWLPAAHKVEPLAVPRAASTPPASIALRAKVTEIFILMAVLGLTFGVPLQFVPMWLAKTPSMAFSPAYFLSTSFFTIMLTRLLFSHLLNGRNESRVVTVCFVIVALAVAVLGQARTPMEFSACAVAYGGAYSLLYPSCTAYLLKQADAAERAEWANWVLLAYEVGARCLPSIFGLVADHGGFPLSFLLLAAIIAIVSAWHISTRRQIAVAVA